MDKKRTVWIQKRHRIVRNIACALLRPYCRWKYGISPEPFLEQYAKATFLRRMANDEDIKGIIVYLASDASLYTTGAIIPIDGGYSAK